MIDILKQHARERRIAIILFVAASLILIMIQWGFRNLSAESAAVVPTEQR